MNFKRFFGKFQHLNNNQTATRKLLDQRQNAFSGKIPKGKWVKDMCTNFVNSLLCFESFKKSGVVVTLVLFIDVQ